MALTFDLIEPVVHEPVDQAGSLRALISAMQAGQVTNLCDSTATRSSRLRPHGALTEALKQVPFSLTLAGNANETACRPPGSFRRPMNGKPGVTHAPMTEPLQFYNRKPSRSTGALASTRY